MEEKLKNVPTMISDYMTTLQSREAIEKFNELSDAYYKEVENCYVMHLEQQKNMNETNKMTGQRQTVEIEPKLSAIENLYREKATDLASNLGYVEEEHDDQHTPQANDNTKTNDKDQQLTDDELREREKKEYVSAKMIDDLARQLRSRMEHGRGKGRG